MAIAVLADLSPSPLGQMISVDFATYSFRSFRFDRAQEPQQVAFPFIATDALQPDDLLVELRGFDEAPVALREDALRLSVEDFQSNKVTLPESPRVILCCRSGLRSWRAAVALRPHYTGAIALMAAGDTSPEPPITR